MEQSILKSVKKVLGLADDYTAFDEDVLMHINSTFAILFQNGIGDTGFYIEDDTETWSDFGDVASIDIVNLTKTYMFLRVKMLFDPPSTSFSQQAAREQVTEYEWRIYALRDYEKSLEVTP